MSEQIAVTETITSQKPVSNIDLTADQLARIFALYWGTPYIYKGVQQSGNGYGTMFIYMISANSKLILTPLSAIRDEDALEVAKIALPQTKLYEYLWFADNGKALVQTIAEGKESNYHYPDAIFITIFQYLIRKGYAVPLWIDVDHPYNGKTAIEIGIAADKTKLGS